MKKIALYLLLSTYFGFAFSQNDSVVGNQRAFYECSDPMDIDSTLIDVQSDKLYFQFNVNQRPKNLKSLGFIWLKGNLKNYFTGYLVNTTGSTFTATRQDGSLIMIQEAKDKDGNWQPLEYWVYSGCGNSYFSPLSLESGKCVLVPIKRYTGNFKTEIRLKFKYDRTIFYSEPFEGTISESQLRKETEKVNGILYRGPASYLESE